MEMKRNRTVFFSSPITQRIWELIPSEEFQSKENSWKLERNQIQNQNLQKIDNFYVDLAKKHIDGVGFIFFVSLCSLDPNKAHEYDMISIRAMKLYGDSVSKPLEVIF